MSRHEPRVKLLHMRDFARKAVEMMRGRTRDDLGSNEMLRLAVTHLVELVGEAASQIPAEVQSGYPQIPWSKVIGTRHRLIHGYDFVDYDILWGTIHDNFPELIEILNRILDEK